MLHARLPRPAGVTLVELLVVLAILALLGALSLPSLRALQARAAVSASANTLLLALHRARAQALATGLATQLCLTGPPADCRAGVGATGYRVGPATGRDVLRVDLPGALRVSASRMPVVYWPWPRAGSTVTFTLCHPGVPAATRQVVVSQTGRPRLQSAAGAACP